jgi:LysR substrate binding domain
VAPGAFPIRSRSIEAQVVVSGREGIADRRTSDCPGHSYDRKSTFRKSRGAAAGSHAAGTPGACRGGCAGRCVPAQSRTTSEAMLVAAAPGHRLAGQQVNQARLLAGERWVGFPSTPSERGSGQTLARQLIRAGLDGADVTLIDSLTVQKRLAQAGFGLALVPESSVRDELRQGALVAHELHGQMEIRSQNSRRK